MTQNVGVMRTARELIEVDDPAWPELAAAIESSPSPVQLLPVSRVEGERVIERLQVTARSVLGALALECGGILVDHGWLRILGGGADGIPDVATINGLATTPAEPPGSLLVALDVLGGRFAIDGGGLGLAPGHVCYFAPDQLRWEDLDVGHGEFVHAMIGGATGQFYDGLRWSGWEEDCANLPLGQGFSLYPPPFATQGQDLESVSRRPVPMGELIDLYEKAARQLDGDR